jgi:hypothetical protein
MDELMKRTVHSVDSWPCIVSWYILAPLCVDADDQATKNMVPAVWRHIGLYMVPNQTTKMENVALTVLWLYYAMCREIKALMDFIEHLERFRLLNTVQGEFGQILPELIILSVQNVEVGFNCRHPRKYSSEPAAEFHQLGKPHCKSSP